MSLSVGGIGGVSGVNPYEAYEDLYAGRISAEDAAEMADAADFDNDLDRVQNAGGVQMVAEARDSVERIEPPERNAASTADYLRGEASHVMEDMMDIQGSLWGFSVRRVIPLAGHRQ